MKKKLYIIIFFLLFIIFIVLMLLARDSSLIKNIKDFVRFDTRILYITNSSDIEYPEEILKKYDIEYLKIDTSKLNIFERKKIQNIIGNKINDKELIIYNDGKKEDSLINYKNIETVKLFLQKNKIIPEEISDYVEEIVESIDNILNSSYSMVYIPYKKIEQLSEQEQIFQNIAEKYNIEYKMIPAYLISENQQEKINKLLGLSLVEDQILILIKDNKMIANIRGIHSKNTYIETLYSVNFIDEIESKINEINYDLFLEKINDKEKSIILIGNKELKDSNDVYNLMNKMIYNYNIEVNYINVENNNTEEYNNIKQKLQEIGYKEGFSLPIVVIVEANKILEYAIGNSKKEYFLEIFIENGVIKGDVINE